jgi:hypothetical protein
MEGKFGVGAKDSANNFHPAIFMFVARLHQLESMIFLKAMHFTVRNQNRTMRYCLG